MANVGHLVKESMVEELSAELSQHPNFIVTSVNRLSAPAADALRQKLHGSQARLFMVKRKLGQRAVAKLNLQGLAELLDGSIALVLAGDDALPAAKLVVEFHKAHEDQIAVRGAVIDGQLLDKSHVEQLAALPSKPVLLAQVVGMIESPIADVIFTLERLIGDVAWLAEQVAAKKPAEPTQKAEAATEPGNPPEAGRRGSPDSAAGGEAPAAPAAEPSKDATPASESKADVTPTEPKADTTEPTQEGTP